MATTETQEQEEKQTMISKEELASQLQFWFTLNTGVQIGHEKRTGITNIERARIDGEISGRFEVLNSMADKFNIQPISPLAQDTE